jgi:hypothetical protein
MPFRPGSLVDVEEVSDTDWRVLRESYYQGTRQAFAVPAGAMTDFASVPRVLV